MKAINKNYFTLFTFILAVVLASPLAFSQNKKSQRKAIKLAENFIEENGFSARIVAPKNLNRELFENLDNTPADTILKKRHNTLQPKAFCIAQDEEFYYVGFLLTRVNKKNLKKADLQTDLPGRSIMVSKTGNKIRISHKDPLFSLFQKL